MDMLKKIIAMNTVKRMETLEDCVFQYAWEVMEQLGRKDDPRTAERIEEAVTRFNHFLCLW